MSTHSRSNSILGSTLPSTVPSHHRTPLFKRIEAIHTQTLMGRRAVPTGGMSNISSSTASVNTTPPIQAAGIVSVDENNLPPVASCEVCGSICSPLMVHYRDTSTIFYRLQQHCRKLVPSILSQQNSTLESARLAQRGILDVSDTLQMIHTLNGPVLSSLKDTSHRCHRSVHILREVARLELDEQHRLEQERLEEMNAANSLPTTPKRPKSRMRSGISTPKRGNSANTIVGGNNSSNSSTLTLRGLNTPSSRRVDSASSSSSSSSSLLSPSSTRHVSITPSMDFTAGMLNSINSRSQSDMLLADHRPPRPLLLDEPHTLSQPDDHSSAFIP